MLPGRQSRWLVSKCLPAANVIAIRLSTLVPYREFRLDEIKLIDCPWRLFARFPFSKVEKTRYEGLAVFAAG